MLLVYMFVCKMLELRLGKRRRWRATEVGDEVPLKVVWGRARR